MHIFWFALLVGGLRLAFGAFVEFYSNCTVEGQRNAKPCSDPCFQGCTSHTCTDGRLEVVCQNLKCRCIPDGIPREVTSLIFTGNRLQILRAGPFQKLKELEELYLRANKICQIEPKAFKGLIKLRRLDLSDNRLQKNKLAFLVYLSKLEELNMSKTVPSRQPKPKKIIPPNQLKKVFYAENYFHGIQVFHRGEHRSPTPKLTELHLEDNNIRQIYSRDLLGLESLENLFLCRNFVDFIENGALNFLIKLNYLNLDGNPLVRLGHTSLLSKSIEFMSLSNTKLFSEPQYPSKHPLNINNSILGLNLSGTNLNTHLLNGFVKYYETLRSLNIDQNNIDILTCATFQNLPSLEELRVANNSLTEISDSSLPPKLWTQLKTLDLSGNPLKCDCKLIEFWQWIKARNFSYSSKLLDNMQCVRYLNEKKQSFIVSKAKNQLKMMCLVEESEWFLWSLAATIFGISFLSTFSSIVHRFRWNIRYWLFTHKIKTRRFKEVQDKKNYTFDAFISYSETDSRWVIHQLLPRLESEYHLRLCIHQRDWLAGRDIAENIVLSIEQSRKTVLIVSNAFAVSQWCHFEMTMAQSRVFQDDRDNLILVMLEEIPDCNISPRLRMLTEKQTYVQWVDHELGQQLFWAKLRQALAKPAESVTESLPPINEFVA